MFKLKSFIVKKLHAILLFPRLARLTILFLGDLFLLSISAYVAVNLYLDTYPRVIQLSSMPWAIPLLIGLQISALLLTGNYRSVIRYGGSQVFLLVARALLFSTVITLVIYSWFSFVGVNRLPKVVLAIDALLALTLITGFRLTVFLLIRQLFNYQSSASRVLIYGAGWAGVQVVRAMTNSRDFRPVGFIDDAQPLQGRLIHGLRVYSFCDLPKLLDRRAFDLVLLAMPSIARSDRQQIVKQLQDLSISVKTIPTLTDMVSDRVAIRSIRNVDINELLGRDEVPPDQDLLGLTVTGKSVLVTGAGGSIGSELCRQIARLAPRCLILYEQSEFALYTIDLELSERYPALQRFPILGSVTDANLLSQILTRYAVQTVYHAAAYKHVPLLENNLTQAILNNVLGSLTVAQLSQQHQVDHFVLISTDKAVRPTSIMGASKRVAELIVQALADQPDYHTRFAIVRFGNVLDSSGSVVPRFRQQIAQGGPVTITHPEMTRYFMSIPEAARLVMQAAAIAQGGEVFVLDMGQPVKVHDLATQMIRLSGLKLGEDIEIKWIGLRPGERLHEELLVNQESAQTTCHPKIFCAQEPKLAWDQLYHSLNDLLGHAKQGDLPQLRQALHQLVPDYHPSVSVSLGKQEGNIHQLSVAS